jgi:signal transduction histidine kinase
MADKQIQHEFYRSPKQLQPDLFDRTNIDKVVVNLLSNAIKFTPRGGKIEMRIWDEAKNGFPQPILKISVTDNGIGISAAGLVRRIRMRLLTVALGHAPAHESLAARLLILLFVHTEKVNWALAFT